MKMLKVRSWDRTPQVCGRDRNRTGPDFESTSTLQMTHNRSALYFKVARRTILRWRRHV